MKKSPMFLVLVAMTALSIASTAGVERIPATTTPDCMCYDPSSHSNVDDGSEACLGGHLMICNERENDLSSCGWDAELDDNGNYICCKLVDSYGAWDYCE